MDEVSIEQLKSSRMREFHAYWNSKQRGIVLPQRQDIDPAEIKSHLPYLVLVDIEVDPFRVRYRLCGSMVQQYDEELTGKYLDELRNTDPATIGLIYEYYRLVVAERRPVFVQGHSISRPTGNNLTMEGGIWPLSSDGRSIDKCVAIEDFPDLL